MCCEVRVGIRNTITVEGSTATPSKAIRGAIKKTVFFSFPERARPPPINLDAQFFLLRKFWIGPDPPPPVGEKFRKNLSFF